MLQFSILQGFADHRPYGIEISIDFDVPEPKDREAAALKRFVANPVALLM
jgi:hypothetical protein